MSELTNPTPGPTKACFPSHFNDSIVLTDTHTNKETLVWAKHANIWECPNHGSAIKQLPLYICSYDHTCFSSSSGLTEFTLRQRQGWALSLGKAALFTVTFPTFLQNWDVASVNLSLPPKALPVLGTKAGRSPMNTPAAFIAFQALRTCKETVLQGKLQSGSAQYSTLSELGGTAPSTDSVSHT